MWHSTFWISILLAGKATAGVISDVLVGRDNAVEAKMRRYVDSIVEPMEIEKRQSAQKMNVSAWDAQTLQACTLSLESLKGVASNPSGLAVCYNLPALDNTTGVFQADLRLFTIAAPTGDFAAIASENVQVGLSYIGATVAPVDMNTIVRRDERKSLISWPRGLDTRQAPAIPKLVQAYAFVGQINRNLLSNDMRPADLQKILVPTVTLTGTDATGRTVKTTLSSNEATFVSGVFAQTLVPSKVETAPPIQTLVVASNAPFVVPGLNILIFPIGAIITGIWAVLFIGTVGYGTVGRMQFRDSYRMRSARAEKGNLARI